MRSWILAVGCCLLLAGCSSNSFLGRSFDNFTAHYNKFYNANRLYQDAAKTFEKEDERVDRTRYLPLFTSQGNSGTVPRELEDAIKKSADVLRDHPNSKWVDDALMLIGKSRFYQRNYAAAEQKFREVIAYGGGLTDEARFWLARTLVANESYELAEEHIRESLNSEQVGRRWQAMLRLALGELYVQREAWAAAAEELAQGVANVKDRDLGARAQFLLGQVYETMEQYEDAVAAYGQVARFKPLYELHYAGRYSRARVEGLHGDAERALAWVQQMERNDNNYQYRNELAFLRASIYQRQEQYEDALFLYEDLLYDSFLTGTGTPNIAGQVHYALAVLYRDAYEDFIAASAHFDTAATRLGGGLRQNQGGPEPQYAAEAITDVLDQRETFNSFATAFGSIVRYDSLLYLGSLPTAAFDSVILELRREKARELEEAARERQDRQQAQAFSESGLNNERSAGARGGKEIPGQGRAPEEPTNEAGFLFHKDAVRVQEARLSFVQTWGNRPHVPNWRRLDAISGASAPGAESVTEVEARLAELRAAGGLPEVDVSAVPRDSARQASMRADRAKAFYELGNALFLSMNRPDSAAAWYRLVIEEDQSAEVARRAYYALAEVQRALGDEAGAERLYQEIVQTYPGSEFAERILAQQADGPAPAAAADTLEIVRSTYAQGYASWQEQDYPAALNTMLALATSYPETEMAPQALLAGGSIYMDWATQDSLDLFGPIPVTLPDTVLIQRGLVAWKVDPVVEDTSTTPAAPTVALDAPADTTAGARPAGEDAATRSDGERAPADSLAQAVEAPSVAAAPVDSLAQPVREAEPLHLARLMAFIAEQYQQTPYAEQAIAINQALEDRKARLQAIADSLARASLPPDSTLAEAAPAPERAQISDRVLVEYDPLDTGTVVPTPPQVEAGPQSLLALIHYPQAALEARVEGFVVIRLIVGESGNVVNPEVIEGLGYGLDEEALRVVQATTYIPGKDKRGQSVVGRIRVTLPFILPEGR